MGWSSTITAAQLTSITTIQYFNQVITLQPGEQADVQIKATFPASPTDDLVIELFSTLDDTSETWDVEPRQSWILPRIASSQNIRSITVAGLYKARIGVRRSVGTDTITNADMSYRKDGVGA